MAEARKGWSIREHFAFIRGGGAVSHVVIDTFETRESGRKGEFGTLAARRFGL